MIIIPCDLLQLKSASSSKKNQVYVSFVKIFLFSIYCMSH